MCGTQPTHRVDAEEKRREQNREDHKKEKERGLQRPEILRLEQRRLL